MSVETKPQTLQGLAFPLQAEAKHAFQQLAKKHINYIQLVILQNTGTKKKNFLYIFIPPKGFIYTPISAMTG